jgi:hypothetical protein
MLIKVSLVAGSCPTRCDEELPTLSLPTVGRLHACNMYVYGQTELPGKEALRKQQQLRAEAEYTYLESYISKNTKCV